MRVRVCVWLVMYDTDSKEFSETIYLSGNKKDLNILFRN